MCDYRGYEFGAGTYPDSYCVDGLLHDADSDHAAVESIPCPICDRDGAIRWWYERWKDCSKADDERSWDVINAEHQASAISLVDDIRRNRGIEPPAEREVRHG